MAGLPKRRRLLHFPHNFSRDVIPRVGLFAVAIVVVVTLALAVQFERASALGILILE
jgi:hypothetical protein